jgi:hypothetical protein
MIPDKPSSSVTPPVIGASPLSMHAMMVTSPVAAGENSTSMTLRFVIDHVSGISRLPALSLNSTMMLEEPSPWLIEVDVTPENDPTKHARPSDSAS